MDFLLDNESFENKLSLLSLLQKSEEGNEEAFQTLEEFALMKLFPSNFDYDVVRSIKDSYGNNSSNAKNIHEDSYAFQRLVNICSSVPNGKAILTNSIIGTLIKCGKNSCSTKNDNLELVFDKNQNFLHTAVISFMALNNLRDITDAFPAVYAVFRCSDVISFSGESNNYCTHISGSTNYNYIVEEKVKGISLSNSLQNNLSVNLTGNDLMSVVIQVVGALDVAYTQYGFKHNSLESGDIYVSKLKEEQKTKGELHVLSEKRGLRSKFKETEVSVKIVNIGMSSIKDLRPYSGKEYDNSELSDVKSFVSSIISELEFSGSIMGDIDFKKLVELEVEMRDITISRLVRLEIMTKIHEFGEFAFFYVMMKRLINLHLSGPSKKHTFEDLVLFFKSKCPFTELNTIPDKTFIPFSSPTLINRSSNYTDPFHYLLLATYTDKMNYSLPVNKLNMPQANGNIKKALEDSLSKVVITTETDLGGLLKAKALVDTYKYSRSEGNTNIPLITKLLEEVCAERINKLFSEIKNS